MGNVEKKRKCRRSTERVVPLWIGEGDGIHIFIEA
jgi:hypothetical protein